MTKQNLAIVFGPNILRTPGTDLVLVNQDIPVTHAFLIALMERSKTSKIASDVLDNPNILDDEPKDKYETEKHELQTKKKKKHTKEHSVPHAQWSRYFQYGWILTVLVAILAIRLHPVSRSLPLFNIGRHRGFELKDIPDLNDKVALVIDSHIGLGKQITKHLAQNGAYVIMACPFADGNAARKDLIETHGIKPNKLKILPIDLSSLQNVSDFADTFRELKLPLHILILNGGVCSIDIFEMSKDGIEINFAMNYLSHFLLIIQLKDILVNSQPAQVAIVSAHSHRESYPWGVGLDLKTQINNSSLYQGHMAYGQSKLALVLMTHKLGRQFTKDNHSVFVNSVNSDVLKIAICKSTFASAGPLWKIIGLMVDFSNFIMGYSLEEGVITPLYAATSPEILENKIQGKYFDPIAIQTEPNSLCANETLQTELWKMSLTTVNKFLKKYVSTDQ